MNQKLAVHYLLDYSGLFILDINSVLREFTLWDQYRLLKGSFCEKFRGTKVLLSYIFFV